MEAIKTITFVLPVEIAREIQKIADEESRTVNELFVEFVRQYRSQKIFNARVQAIKRV